MSHVFVSYANPDQAAAFRIADFLETEGIACWIAPRNVGPGQEYGAAIITGIETSVALVLVFSESANESGFVRKEVERAVSKAKPILPVRVREARPSGSLEFFISSAQSVDAFASPMEQHLSALTQAVRALGGEAASAPATRLIPLAPRPKPVNLKLLLGVAAVAVVVAGLGLWAWAPWQNAWQKNTAGFLAGRWCQPMSGEAFMHVVFAEAGPDAVNGRISYTHSTDMHPFRAKVTGGPESIEIVWAEPAELASQGPVRFRVIDKATIVSTGAPNNVPWTRCLDGK
ncbi:MAG: toll/interleukin-1 receptor domain-containing protein [Alphaproteobacteria bacterium]|nr:toll/interleukin-1 receptor domain-containing protein [Alphaproteobacteria bacterium]